MIHQLVQFAEKNLPNIKPGFREKYVKWAILANSFNKKKNRNNKNNDSFEILDLSGAKENKRGLLFSCAPDLSFSELASGEGREEGRTHFLINTAEVIGSLSESKKQKHEFFKEILSEAALSAEMPELEVIANLLDNSLDKIQASFKEKKVKIKDVVTFAVDGEYLVESEKWHPWWQEYRATLVRDNKAEANKLSVPCLITGKLLDNPVRIHGQISGLKRVGANPRSSLVSFDKESFGSYGSERGMNAPMSEEVVLAYSKALEYLIANSSFAFGDSLIVYWFDSPVKKEDDPLPFVLMSTQQEEKDDEPKIKELKWAIQTGKRPDLINNKYYILVLSGVSGRIMVRDWVEGDFKDLVSNINNWFNDLSVISSWGEGLIQPPSFFDLLKAMALDGKIKRLPTPVISGLFESAIKNRKISRTALLMAFSRLRSNIAKNGIQKHDELKMAIIKAWHERNEVSMGNKVNKNNKIGYHCGRLLAVLSSLQKAALPNVKVGVTQSSFGAASSAPGLVFGRLLKVSQHHLGKLRNSKKRINQAIFYENKIADVVSEIGDSIPTILGLEEQTQFSLGYYQQLASDRHRAMEIKKSREEKTKKE
jgi:CRISPR-associated protein Csd1